MTTPRDDISGLRKWNDDWPHWQFTEHQHDALRLVLDYSEGAAAKLDALQARVKELEAERDEARKAADLGCDANNGGPHSVITDRSYKFCGDCGETIKNPTLQERARAAEARATRLQQERDEAYERAAKVADERVVKLRAKAKGQKLPHNQHHFALAIEARVIAAAIRRLAGPEKEGK